MVEAVCLVIFMEEVMEEEDKVVPVVEQEDQPQA